MRRSTLVHPRIRGEHVPPVEFKDPLLGSSPHTRGTPGRRLAASARCRFIPAYAGNTDLDTWPSRTRPVHPRIRGEHKCTV